MKSQSVAVVTGGGSGIGEATARRLARAGYPVAVLDVEGEKAEAVAVSIVAHGCAARGWRVDVTDTKAISAASEEISRQFGRVEILVNSAGILQNATRVLDMSLEEADRILR